MSLEQFEAACSALRARGFSGEDAERLARNFGNAVVKTVTPGGDVLDATLTPEQWARMEDTSRAFDPVTLERLSIKRHREASERNSRKRGFENMTVEEMQKLGDRYQARFSNLDEIAAPSILMRPEFLEMVQIAVDTGRQLTRKQLVAALGPIDWEEDLPWHSSD